MVRQQIVKRIHKVITVAVLLQGTLCAQSPSVDQVLQHFVNALGGKKNLEKIHTMVLRGTMEFPDFKAQGVTSEYFRYPDSFAAITEISGHGTTTFVFDGSDGWQLDPRNQLTKLSGADLSDIRRRSHIHWNLRLREFYPGLQLKGREDINGQDAWKLEANLEGATYDFLFDVRTGLLVRFDTDQHAQNGSSSVSISDYRRVGNVFFAFGASQTVGSIKWNRKLTEVKFNEPIADSFFRKPDRNDGGVSAKPGGGR